MPELRDQDTAAAAAQLVECHTKVPIRCNSTDVSLIPGRDIGVRKNPSRAIYDGYQANMK